MRLPAAEVAAMADVLHEHSNARLLAVEGPGAIDSRGRPTGNGATLWSGDVPGFLDRDTRDALVNGMQVQEHVDTFTILDAAGASPVEVAGPGWVGTTVTIEDRRYGTPVTTTWRVRDLQREASGVLDGLVLDLETIA